jgi:hypothetical protein
MIIHCRTLTTCDAIGNGEIVKLDFVDEDGSAVSLLLAFEHAQSIAMTLPRLLTQAVRAQTGLDSTRYVFSLGEWILEGTECNQSVILTLKTEDGFEVSFRIPPGACKSLGQVLQREGTDGDSEGSAIPELH